MHQSIFTKQPFVRIVTFLVIGIIVQSYLSFNSKLIIGVLLVLILLYCISSLFHTKQIKLPLNGLLIATIIFLFGMYVFFKHNNSASKNNQHSDLHVAKILEIPKAKNKVYQAELLVISSYSENIWYEQDIKVMASFKHDSCVSKLLAGQMILFTAELSQVKEKRNPFDFDYKRYLKLKSIENTVYLKSDQWEILSDQASGIKQIALNLRQKIIHLFENAGIEGEQLAVFSALTLGYKDMLDAKIRKAYTGAGATHVLAVSGLHVGIVLYVLKFIFGFFGYFKKRIKLNYFLIIAGIWFYALVTGMSTSVLRSALMFSFLLFGLLINKRLHIYNSLAASAFFLLLINPNYIFEVGFQLSYAAVAGIVFFQPKIEKLIYFKNSILRKAWALTAVSLAAQLSTFPITIYYFHQFPSYFWLSNIVVILGAIAFICSGFILVFLSPFSWLFQNVGYLINELIVYLNNFVFSINQLPNAIVKDLSLTTSQVYLIYFLILCFSFWLITKKYEMLIYSLSIVVLLLGMNVYYSAMSKQNKKICVYHIPGTSVIHIVDGDQSSWLVTDKQNIKTEFLNMANIYWKAKDLKGINELRFDTTFYSRNVLVKKNFLGLLNFKGFIINEHIDKNFLYSTDSLNLDFILISSNTKIKYQDLPKNIKYDAIIIDGSVPPWRVYDWQKAENVCVHQTAVSGSYILTDNE